MDATPSTSSQLISPPKKRKRLALGHLSLTEKQCILNMYKQIIIDAPDMKTTAIVLKIVDTIGVAKCTVYRTIKEYKETGKVVSSRHAGGRCRIIASYYEGVKNSVRQVVHSFFFKNEIPTLDKILNQINCRPDLPNMSRSSLYIFLKQLNFKYIKRNRKSILIERHDIIIWRRKYLRYMQQYRREGRPIYYLDETWLNEGHTKEKVWIDNTIKNKRQAFIKGLSTGLKSLSGKGKRLIVLHAGSELGFVDGGLLLFKGRKSADYHEEMNAAVFEEWFSCLLKKLPDRAVIVMDNASYHSRKTEKIPTTSSTKKSMQEWLQSKHIEFDADMVRSELLNIISLHKEKYNLYVNDELAKHSNKTVLRLPPYHCELNPIELIWAQIKNGVASKNESFKLRDVKGLLLQEIQNVKDIHWRNCVKHVIKVEAEMCKLDKLMDNVVEPLIISVNPDSSSQSSDDD